MEKSNKSKETPKQKVVLIPNYVDPDPIADWSILKLHEECAQSLHSALLESGSKGMRAEFYRILKLIEDWDRLHDINWGNSILSEEQLKCWDFQRLIENLLKKVHLALMKNGGEGMIKELANIHNIATHWHRLHWQKKGAK